jgi:sodium transport system permease protein
MTAILTVTRKELMDGFRDRRSIYTILFGTLFGPLLLGFMLYQLAGDEKSAQEIQIPVVGRELAPVLMRWLGQQSGVEIVAGPADPEAAVRDRKVAMVLVVEKEFSGKFRESRPAPVKLYSDSTRSSTRAKVKRLNALLSRFSGETGALRLIARGISPEVASALKVEPVEISNAQQRAAMIFDFLPMFMVLAALTAAMQIATDSTAGERERGSLEPLLLNPLPRWQFVAGKWLAAVAIAAGGMTGTLLLVFVMMSKLPLEDLGFRLHLDPPQILLLLTALLPMALVGPALEIYLACFAKSFKEAQSYMSFLILAVTIPGVVSNFYPLTNRPWLQPIPVIGQFALGSEILEGKIPPAWMLAAAALSAVALTVILLMLAQRLLSNEKIIFER